MGAVNAKSTREVAPARRCAYTVLRRVFEGGAYADQALHAASKELDPRDRALAMRLSYGAVQRRGTIDHFVDSMTDRGADGLDPPLIAALRLGLYELLYLQGSPDYAVVADTVELAKSSSRGGHGLVNAVMRRAAREGAPALLATLGEESPERAAVMHSHPEWMARMWWSELGPERARSLMAADNEPSEVSLRANTLLTSAEELAAALPVPARLDPLAPEAVVLGQALDLHGSPLFAAGAFIAQARAAMLVSRMLAPEPGQRVLDLCAAPGGKTTHIAALMRDEGEVVAVERSKARAGVLARTAQRMRTGIVRVEVGDAAQRRAPGQPFDRVLVDPPCSGLGTLQHRADLRWRASPASVAELAALQGRILAAGASCVCAGGLLVYSTCTISPDENERLIASFLHSNPAFAIEDLSAQLPALAPAGGAGSGALQTLPDRDRTAGFYIARLRRS